MLKIHTHLHKLPYTSFIQKLFKKDFKNPMFSIFRQLNRAQALRRGSRCGITETKVLYVFELTIDSPLRLSTADLFCISQLPTVLLGCRQVSFSMAKIIVVVHWTVDNFIGLSTTLVNRLGQILNKTRFSLFKLFCLIPKRVCFILLGLYQCFIDWFSFLMFLTYCL